MLILVTFAGYIKIRTYLMIHTCGPYSQPRQPYYQLQTRMDPEPSPVIHEILPTEIMEMIFEEHAILDWKAPTIDGRVCRFWRQTVLNTPRAWSHITIRKYHPPSVDELRLWLHRARTAPLHINTRAARIRACQRLYDIFSDHRARISSLRMQYGSETFFEGRDFPCMQHLDVTNWYPSRWGSMPKLQSLRVCDKQFRMVPLGELPPLKMLTLAGLQCTSVLRHSQSLTKLILNNVSLVDAISGPATFPSLIYLSLWGAKGLKPHINAPRLVTYHEEGYMEDEPFHISLPSLVEYGVYHPSAGNLDTATCHLSFPNIQRLAIRAKDPVILSLLTSLAHQPHLLPTLHTISVGSINGMSYCFAEEIQEKIKSLVIIRNEACNGNVMVCFETREPFKIPIFFGAVSDLSIKWSCAFLTHILVTRSCLLKTLRSQVFACSHSSPKLCSCSCVHFSPFDCPLINFPFVTYFMLKYLVPPLQLHLGQLVSLAIRPSRSLDT